MNEWINRWMNDFNSLIYFDKIQQFELKDCISGKMERKN